MQHSEIMRTYFKKDNEKTILFFKNYRYMYACVGVHTWGYSLLWGPEKGIEYPEDGVTVVSLMWYKELNSGLL